jgi:hypothetical protein
LAVAAVTAIAVIVPVLGRPQNAQPLVDSLAASTDRARLVFVVSPDDEDEITACWDAVDGPAYAKYPPREETNSILVADWPSGSGDYARKIQAGYDATTEDLVLLGADDLVFHPGWLEAVMRVADEFDVGVIGTNDTANPSVLAGRHSTHPVVRRCYIDRYGGVVGYPGMVYWTGYSHQCVDSELCATAIARGCYAHAHDAVVAHRHPLWGTAPTDATYEKSRADTMADQRLFDSRRAIWERERVEA